MVIFLVGNKCDLKGEEDVEIVPEEEIVKLSREFDIPYFEASAKSNINIRSSFKKLAEEIYQRNKSRVQQEAQGVNLRQSKNFACCSD